MSQQTQHLQKKRNRTKKPDSEHDLVGYKTFLEHLIELRTRLTWSAVVLVAGGIVGYSIHRTIFKILIRPFNKPLYYTSPAGGLDFLIKICIFFGFICALPVLVYHLLKFLEPALPTHMRKGMAKVLFSSIILAMLGICFAYFISLPAALYFLTSLGNGELTALISANEYLNFVMIYLAAFAVLFQLPLCMLFINRFKPLKTQQLMKYQGYIILGSFIVAAILTPTPDPLNQTIMAIPIIILYELSVALIWLKNRKTA